MKTNTTVDTAKLSLLLNELRLPAIKLMWPQFAEQADKEGWPVPFDGHRPASRPCGSASGARVVLFCTRSGFRGCSTT